MPPSLVLRAAAAAAGPAGGGARSALRGGINPVAFRPRGQADWVTAAPPPSPPGPLHDVRWGVAAQRAAFSAVAGGVTYWLYGKYGPTLRGYFTPGSGVAPAGVAVEAGSGGGGGSAPPAAGQPAAGQPTAGQPTAGKASTPTVDVATLMAAQAAGAVATAAAAGGAPAASPPLAAVVAAPAPVTVAAPTAAPVASVVGDAGWPALGGGGAPPARTWWGWATGAPKPGAALAR